MSSISDWPPKVEVLVLPGFPDREIEDIDGKKAYPSAATDVVKVLRSKGLTVDYTIPRASRAIVSLKAAELWIPILVVLQSVLINWGTADLRDAFLLWRDRVQPSVLHVKIGVFRDRDREIRWVQASGSPDEVVEVIKTFRDSLLESDGDDGSD